MQIHNLVQNSPEWHAHRLAHFNASDAPAMMGCDPYRTRSQLIAELATGIRPEPDAHALARFAEGHAFEARARPVAEEIIGAELFPVVGTNGKLSASFDGLDMLEVTAFEHKRINNDIRAAFAAAGEQEMTGAMLPLRYQVQMEHQCMVSEQTERVLFMATNWNGDEMTERLHCWYTPNPELAAQIEAGWQQVEADVCAYVPEASKAEPIAKVIEALPALTVQVEGRVITSNLLPFQQKAAAFLANIKTDLQTDQDFADAEQVIKFCSSGEERLKLVKEQALAQTATIGELFNVIDSIAEDMRQKRLALTRKVETRKTEIRHELVAEAQRKLDEHVTALNQRLGAPWVPRQAGGFAEAIKGKRTVGTCQDAISVALAQARITASAIADRLDANRKALVRDGQDWFFLFADFAHVASVPADVFSAIADQRIRKHQDDEAARKAQAEAAAAAATAATTAPITPAAQPAPIARPAIQAVAEAEALLDSGAKPAAPAVRAGAVINTGELCKRLGFVVTAEFLTHLGIQKAPNPEGKKVGSFYFESEFAWVCELLQAHLQGLIDAQRHAEQLAEAA